MRGKPVSGVLLRHCMFSAAPCAKSLSASSLLFVSLHIGLIIAAALSSAHSYAADSTSRSINSKTSKIEDPCDYAFDEMVLKRTWSQGNQTYAVFEIRIGTTEKEPMVIQGWRETDGFHVRRPRVSFEFKDLSGQLSEFPGIPGSFLGPPDRLLVSHEKRAEVTVTLLSSDIMEKAIEWKMVLRGDGRCLKSLPFRVIQKRGPVEGYVSDSVPDYWNKEGKTPCCNKKPEPKK